MHLNLNDKEYIAYKKINGSNTNQPGIVFLTGFMSDMQGVKASAIEKFAKEKGYNFLCFDYFGHGLSSGKFSDCTISTWVSNVISVLDNLTTGKQIIVGSSMGGWLMLLASLIKPEKIAGLFGIAAAPDFTEGLIWNMLSTQQKDELQQHNSITLPSDYCEHNYLITKALIENGRKHLLLNKEKIEINCPVYLIHGMKDKDVPYNYSIKLAEKLQSQDVIVKLIKEGNHRMSDEDSLKMITEDLERFMQKV
jgi:pimeloyl-ACP methyl ester carboxylesterase